MRELRVGQCGRPRMYDQTANYERELARELGDVPLCQDLDRNIDVLWAYSLQCIDV